MTEFLKILHTSDWHLGRSLYGRRRYDEFSAFLDWLGDTIEAENVDVLLVAGDVFDTTTPGNRAQELYYRFLCRTAGSCCREIVVIAGNHDSPSFLNAPRELLRALHVQVVGARTENPEEEVLWIGGGEKAPAGSAVICAVPYLRDKDVRTVAPGETVEEKTGKIVEGIRNHYQAVCRIAAQRRDAFLRKHRLRDPEGKVPIIAMGHLFAAGGKTVEGDGVRELYVGSLAHVGREIFPENIDYLALGHLHVAQKVGGAEHIRYSGAPIPMGFGEAGQEKKVVIVEFQGRRPNIREIPVPCFQPLERISGTLENIQQRIEQLKQANSRAWLEIEYTGTAVIGDLRNQVEQAAAESDMEIRRIRNRQVMQRVLSRIHVHETLDDLNEQDVFQRCLDAADVPVEERPDLIRSYQEIVRSLQEEDRLEQ